MQTVFKLVSGIDSSRPLKDPFYNVAQMGPGVSCYNPAFNPTLTSPAEFYQ